MPTFAYTAIDRTGSAAFGKVEAASPALARRKLEQDGLTLHSLEPVAVRPAALPYAAANPGGPRERLVGWFMSRSGIAAGAVTGFYRDLATMLDAGIGIRQALGIQRQQTAGTSPAFHAVVTSLHDHVAGGGTLGEAMARHAEVFEDLEVRAVEAGELAGILEDSLKRLAKLRENRHRLRRRVMTALMYPAIVLVVAITITMLVMTFLVPMILEPVLARGGDLPAPTRVVKFASDVMIWTWWLWILAIGLGVFFLRRWIRTPAGRRSWDGWLLRAPVLGKLVLKHTAARTLMVMATLLRSGIGLVETLGVAARTCPNTVLAEGIGRWHEKVNAGADPEIALADSGAFAPLALELVPVVAVGSQTGTLDDSLERMAETYEQDVQQTADRLAAIVEPALLVFLGGLVLLIALAVLLPIMELWSVL